MICAGYLGWSVRMKKNFHPGYQDLGLKHWDFSNRASPAIHTVYIYTSNFFMKEKVVRQDRANWPRTVDQAHIKRPWAKEEILVVLASMEGKKHIWLPGPSKLCSWPSENRSLEVLSGGQVKLRCHLSARNLVNDNFQSKTISKNLRLQDEQNSELKAWVNIKSKHTHTLYLTQQLCHCS